MSLPDPNGSIGRLVWLGEKALTDGDVSVTITLPMTSPAWFLPVVATNWMTSTEKSYTDVSFTVTFGTPAPAGGIMRWGVLI